MKRERPNAQTVHRLLVVKTMIAGMKDAMPTLAASLRREASEAIDDIIADLGGKGRAHLMGGDDG